MAMVCVNGVRECTGCMACLEEPKVITTCYHCGEPIHEGEDYYDIHNEVIHEDCLRDWASEYKR